MTGCALPIQPKGRVWWRAWLLLLAGLFSWPGVSQANEAGPESQGVPFLGGFLTESRVLYPLAVGPWRAQGEHLYDDQELGASVRYVHAGKHGGWIDLYFYPAGLVDDARVASEARQTLAGIQGSAGQPGSYLEVAIQPLAVVAFGASSGKPEEAIQAQSAALRLLRDGGTYHSAMVLYQQQLYFVKGRYSVAAEARSQRKVQQELEAFMEEVSRKASFFSTGACWEPPPVVRVPAPLAVGQPGQLATAETDGVVAAVAYADRVEALQAAEAKPMQVLSMALTGRLYPGCVPVEDMNPQVPEGMRELRLEFSAPADGGRRQSPPLRLPRRGTG